MDVLREGWENPEPAHQSSMQFVEELKTCLKQVSQLTQEPLCQAQQWQKESMTEK